MSRRIRRPGKMKQEHHIMGGTLREIEVGIDLPPVEELAQELREYTDVLMGRTHPPIDAGVLTLMEVADAYFARASEIQTLILEKEREGDVFRGSVYYKFRTGELRSFLEMAKRAADLGSRRLTHQKHLMEMQHDSLGLDFYE